MQDGQKEIWKPTHNPNYLVSNIGRIKSLSRKSFNDRSTIKEKILKLANIQGYHVTTLFENGIRRMWKVHRLVATAFIPNPDNKSQINHKNAIRDDNRVENLEWVTHQENADHALENGLLNPPLGENHENSKLTDQMVIEARKDYSNGNISIDKIAEKYGVSSPTMRKAIRGETWKYISDSVKDKKISLKGKPRYTKNLYIIKDVIKMWEDLKGTKRKCKIISEHFDICENTVYSMVNKKILVYK